MRLTAEEYGALETIVGAENISQDPVVGESYNQVWGNKLVFGQKHTTPPAAVLCPGTTEEIVAIVKLCNERGILFKALASGFEWVATVLEKERGILLDLRRMDRILRIDEKNMLAVVEPFVSCHKLQLEINKLGLYIGKPGVGYSGNVIAVACCHQEMTISQIYTSGYGRNVLGCEWVLPTGEVLELGTSGHDDGWFSADGPGPSLRGILRGRSGANGGHGVLTKASVKLYPYYGEVPGLKRLPGEPPSAAQLESVPSHYRAFVFTFPTMDDMLRASAEIGHAELACVLAPGYIATGFNGEGNDEEWAMIRATTPEDRERDRNSVPVTINGHSARELEYREKAALSIMQKWGGHLDPALNDPDVQARRFQYQFWSTGVPAVRATGDFMVSIQGADGSPEMQMRHRPVEIEAFKPFAESGAILQNTAGVVYRPQEHYSLGCSGGVGTSFDPWDPASLEAATEYQDRVYDPATPFRRFGYTNRGAMMQIESIHHIHERWGPMYDGCDYWLRRVKAMLDPNNVADWSAYIPAEYSTGADDGAAPTAGAQAAESRPDGGAAPETAAPKTADDDRSAFHIVVCMKAVVDPEVPYHTFTIDAHAKRPVPPTGLPPVFSPFDENALECALRIKDQHPQCRVTVLSLGTSVPRSLLQAALAAGADRAIAVEDPGFEDLDPFSTAAALTTAIKQTGAFDLVLTGRQASDWDSGLVWAGLAERLDLPCVTVAQKVELRAGRGDGEDREHRGDGLLIERCVSDGVEIVESQSPALVTVSNEAGELRNIPLAALMRAKKAPIERWSAADVGFESLDVVGLADLTLPSLEVTDRYMVEGEDARAKGRDLARKLLADGVLERSRLT